MYDAQAAGITPPASGKNTIVLASATSSARLRFPKSWRNAYITIQADSVDLYVTFGGTTITADETAVTTLTSEAPSAHGTGECIKIPAGQERNFLLTLLLPATNSGVDADPLGNVRMAWKASATGGYIRIIRSSAPVDLNETGV